MMEEATKSQINKEKSPLLRKGRTACGGIKMRAVQTVRPSYSHSGKRKQVLFSTHIFMLWSNLILYYSISDIQGGKEPYLLVYATCRFNIFKSVLL